MATTKETVWDTIAAAPPEFWCGVAVGLIIDKFLRKWQRAKIPAERQ